MDQDDAEIIRLIAALDQKYEAEIRDLEQRVSDLERSVATQRKLVLALTARRK